LIAAALFGCLAGLLVSQAQAGPSDCAGGPTIRGATVQGTPCADVLVAPRSADRVYGGGGDDRIYAHAGVHAIDGGGGDDVLYGHAPRALAADCPEGCNLGLGSQTFDGGPGSDVVYGERGNDVLNGNGGEDRLYGGIGDDTVLGGADGDLVSGGWGADTVDGGAGDDYVRGDGTADELKDTGGGTDTLSYATGVTPGFPDRVATNRPTPWYSYPNFPGEAGERGVYVDLGQSIGDNNQARFGGGLDTGLVGADFENVIGTPFSDYIVGSAGANTIHGGGGGDVILGADGGDTIYGGADGDHLDGGAGTDAVDGEAGSDHCAYETATNCEPANTGGVVLRAQSTISVGLLAPAHPGTSHVYLSGSEHSDDVTATYAPGPPATVTFTASSSDFDESAEASAGCSTTPSQAVCTLSKPLDAIVLYGGLQQDEIEAGSFPSSTSVILVGGPGGDALSGGSASEDLLVDDPTAAAAGADALSGLGGDDALINNEGLDQVNGGEGNDLLLSASVCDGDVLDGGLGTDNGSWARLLGVGVEARIGEGRAGEPGTGSGPVCGAGQLDALASIEDLEGSGQADHLYGGPGPNNLLGWGGADLFRPRAGDDRVFANSGDSDPQIHCGDGLDRALLDRDPPHDDNVAVDCEIFEEADPVTYGFTVEPLGQPTFSGTDPPSPANDNFPEVLGSAVAGSSVRLYTSPGCSEASLAATGTADEFASPGITVSVPGNSTTTFYATARSANSGSACSTTSIAYTESSPPENPIAVDDTATVAEDSGPTLIDVLANDQDPDGGEMTILTTSLPSFGTVAITGGGSGLTYEPAPDRCGPTSFAYTLNGGSSATVSVAVTCAPEPPRRVFRCDGIRATRHGSARRDVINGTPRRDVIAALGGNDLVRGRGGNDLICGGRGRDTLLGGRGRDTLLGGSGRDRLFGGPGRDRTRQ
jgi:Ca2+-binding RTX toxin-like protein